MYDEAIIAGLSDAVSKLVRAGHEESVIYDNMLALALGHFMAHRGARELSRELYLMAVRAAAEADREERGRGVAH